MKKILVILVLVFAFSAPSFSTVGIIPANKKYTSVKYKKKMRKKSRKAISKMCENKHFKNSAYRSKQYVRH
jgi:hypothetical protein